jgi:hypothetical protein
MFADLTSRVAALERDLLDFPVTYYFGDADERFSWPAQVEYVVGIANRATRLESSEGSPFYAALLREALEDLARTTAILFYQQSDLPTEATFKAQARDHRVDNG